LDGQVQFPEFQFTWPRCTDLNIAANVADLFIWHLGKSMERAATSTKTVVAVDMYLHEGDAPYALVKWQMGAIDAPSVTVKVKWKSDVDAVILESQKILADFAKELLEATYENAKLANSLPRYKGMPDFAHGIQELN
jgi:hypothetical protein